MAAVGRQLGCGIVGVFLTNRATPSVITRDLTPDLVPGARCTRVLNDVSDASITLMDCYDGPAIVPWLHSLLFTWDGEFIWNGPITKVAQDGNNQGQIEAQDIMVWMRHRLIRTAFNTVGAAVDASAAFVTLVSQGFNQDTSVPYSLTGVPTGINVEREFKVLDMVYVMDAIDDIVTTGSDYSVFLNEIFCGDVEASVHLDFVLNPSHMKTKPTVTLAGDDQATKVSVLNEEAITINEAQNNTAITAYGLLDFGQRLPDIKTNTEAFVRANNDLAARDAAPVLVEGIQLEVTAPITINDLVPGMEFDLYIPGNVAPYSGPARIQSIDIVEDDADGRWSVTLHCITVPS